MTAELQYKLSVFGDFMDITPNTDTVLALTEGLRKFQMIPSSFQELGPITPPSPPNVLNRLLMHSDSDKESVTVRFSFQRIDIDFTTKTEDGLRSVDACRNRTKDIIKAINEKYPHKFSRLALNTQTLFVPESVNERDQYMSKFQNTLGFFKTPAELFVRLMNRTEFTLHSSRSNVNVIMATNTFAGSVNLGGKEMPDGFSINFDINTVVLEPPPVYTVDDFINFAQQAEEKRQMIKSDLFNTTSEISEK
jgi:hypothetical protein